MLGINLYLYKNTKVSLLQNCPSFNDYVILCAAARVNTLRVSSLLLRKAKKASKYDFLIAEHYDRLPTKWSLVFAFGFIVTSVARLQSFRSTSRTYLVSTAYLWSY